MGAEQAQHQQQIPHEPSPGRSAKTSGLTGTRRAYRCYRRSAARADKGLSGRALAVRRGREAGSCAFTELHALRAAAEAFALIDGLPIGTADDGCTHDEYSCRARLRCAWARMRYDRQARHAFASWFSGG